MPNNLFYYIDWKSSAGWRYRLEIIPPGLYNDPLAKSGIPDWGQAPPLVSNFYQAGGEVLFVIPEDSESGYEDVPVGFPTLQTLSLTLNLANLNSTTELRDLRAYLVKPNFPDGGAVGVRGFPTSPVFVLWTDRGGSNRDFSLAGAPFFRAFEGKQEVNLENNIRHDRVNNVTEFKVELINLITACFKECKPGDLQNVFINGAYSGLYEMEEPWAFNTYGQIVLDDVYLDEAQNNIYFSANIGGVPDHTKYTTYYDAIHSEYKVRADGVTPDKLSCHMFRLKDLFHALGKCLTKIYQMYTRDVDARFSIYGYNTNYSGADPYGDTDTEYLATVGTPFDTWEMYERNLEPDGGIGDKLAHDNRWFCGEVYHFVDGGMQVVDGYCFDFSNSEGPGIFHWGNMLEYFDECLLGGVAKCTVYVDQTGSILGKRVVSVACQGIWEHVFNSPAIGADAMLNTIADFTPGTNVMTGANVEIPGAWSTDPSTIENKPDGGNGKDLSLTMPLHNMPDSRDPQYTVDHAAGTLFTKDCHGLVRIGFRTNTLFYKATIPGIPHDMFVRIHETVRHYNGENRDVTAVDYGVPLFERPTPTHARDMSEDLLDIHIKQSEESCMPFIASRVPPREFGAPQQTLFNDMVPLDIGWWQDIGGRIGADFFPNGNIFLPTGETYYSDIPGQPVVLKSQDDWENATAKVKLFAKG